MPGPKASGNIRVNVMMGPKLKKEITYWAGYRGVSFSEWMRDAAKRKIRTERRKG